MNVKLSCVVVQEVLPEYVEAFDPDAFILYCRRFEEN